MPHAPADLGHLARVQNDSIFSPEEARGQRVLFTAGMELGGPGGMDAGGGMALPPPISMSRDEVAALVAEVCFVEPQPQL